MTYIEISYEDFAAKVKAEIRRMTLRGEGCRTSECSDNSLLVSRILGGDGYCGKDPRMPKDGYGWTKKAIRALVESDEIIPMAGAGYCWLVPSDLTHKNGIGAEPCGLFGLY